MDLETPKILFRQRPYMLLVAYRISTWIVFIVIIQIIISCIYLLMYYSQLIYYFFFKINYTWTVKNEAVCFKYLFRAMLNDVFIAVPRVRAFIIFYTSLKAIWVSLNFLIIKFNLGKPIMEVEKLELPLTHKDYLYFKKKYTNNLSIIVLTLLLLLSFLIIKLPLSIFLGISYVSFILACRFIYNSHWEFWFQKNGTWRSLYERTITFGILLMVDNSFITRFKITGELVQLDSAGNIIYNQFFKNNSTFDTASNKAYYNNSIQTDDNININNCGNFTDTNSDLSDEELLIDRAFAEVFGENTLAANPKKLSLAEIQKTVDQLNENILKIDPEIDYSVYSKDTTLHYRIVFNPKYTNNSSILTAFKDSKILTKSKDLPVVYDSVSSYVKNVFHPCLRILKESNVTNVVQSSKIIFKGFSTTYSLPYNKPNEIVIRPNSIQHYKTISFNILNKKQYSIPTAIGDELLFKNIDNYSNDNSLNREYLSSIIKAIYNQMVIESAIGDTLDDYHLTYEKQSNNLLLTAQPKKLSELNNVIESSSITFVTDVNSVIAFVNYLFKNNLLTSTGLVDLKLQFLLATTNTNDIIIIPGKKPRTITYEDLNYLQNLDISVPGRSNIINKTFDSTFGTYLNKFEIKH